MDQYSEDLLETILVAMRDEAKRLGATFAIENHEKGGIADLLQASVKTATGTFRITMQYVREDAVKQGHFPSGWAYIETDWDLRLRHRMDSSGTVHRGWYCEYRSSSGRVSEPPVAHGHLVDERWLRALIRQKLVSPHTQ